MHSNRAAPHTMFSMVNYISVRGVSPGNVGLRLAATNSITFTGGSIVTKKHEFKEKCIDQSEGQTHKAHVTYFICYLFVMEKFVFLNSELPWKIYPWTLLKKHDLDN